MKSVTVPLTVITVVRGGGVLRVRDDGGGDAAVVSRYLSRHPRIAGGHRAVISRVAVGDVMRPLGAVLTLCALIAGAVSLRYRLGRR
ncbi:hypothetical protein [Nocardia niwae]|uniref:hypothetical protein n=1 Tax=Nocardia niwae TaxID=626084 RepID=UPI00340A45EC